MRKLKKLPSHISATAQTGGRYAAFYSSLMNLEIDECVAFEFSDFGCSNMDECVNAVHSITQSLRVRKGQTKRFSVRRDNEAKLVYAVRVS